MTASQILASLALVALLPGAAGAQFTTFVAPPKKDTVVLADTLAAPAPTADSVARASITNMKAWVDSAAGDAVDLRARSTPAADPLPAPPAFTDGSPAPDTATPLPMMLAMGVGAIGAGVTLLRRR